MVSTRMYIVMQYLGMGIVLKRCMNVVWSSISYFWILLVLRSSHLAIKVYLSTKYNKLLLNLVECNYSVQPNIIRLIRELLYLLTLFTQIYNRIIVHDLKIPIIALKGLLCKDHVLISNVIKYSNCCVTTRLNVFFFF